MKKLKPKDWSKYEHAFDAFAKALCVPKVEVDPRYIRQAKYYNKYLNIPELYREFNDAEVFKILDENFKNETQEDREDILNELWPPEDKVACIFIAPLAIGDMWDLFAKVAKDEQEFKERIQDIRKTAKCTLKALVVLHAKGRLHLDIKPENIFKANSEKGKTIMQLADFGLLDFKTTKNNDKRLEVGGIDYDGFAKDIRIVPARMGSPSSSNSASVRWKVTDRYKAPEQTKWEPLDIRQMAKIDIYSLGATLLVLYEAAKTSMNDARKKTVSSLIENIPKSLQDVDKNYKTAAFPEIRRAEKELLNLASYMTLEDPKKRPSASEALTHAFIRMKI